MTSKRRRYICQYMKQYRRKHRQELNAYKVKWNKKHPFTKAQLKVRYKAFVKYRDKKRAWLRKIKDVPCKDCGKRYHCCIMEFDHVRGKKLFTIGPGIVGRSTKRLIAEMAKCDIVCANCHRWRTWKRRNH